ncbi:hypothetical protein N1F78_13420 [Seonamhaeicola sp. MEBiC1930]|uniref:hypothetical protein n=1 Tax=Seonamhaeicola sp. MEBiC01930 TaxID=2976768 RepID=UPI003246B22B
MKTIKAVLTLSLVLFLGTTHLNAQQAFQIHQDNVKPSKVGEYEKIAKEFHEASTTHNLQASWITAMSDDFTYYYITPIENFAELDKNPFADMAEAMGDKFKDMFNRFDQCYSSHGSYIMHSIKDLSYPAPEGTDMSDQNYRKWFKLYYSPKNKAKLKEGMKAVKDMFAAKGSTNYYNVYHSGFGSMKSYFLVSVPAKDEIDSAQKTKANEEVLGPDRFETFNKVLNYVSKWEEETGWMRPDLHYSPKTE